MRKKIISYSLLLLLGIGISFFLLLSSKMPTSQKLTTSVIDDEEIVASAIVDSVNDVTRVPTLQSGVVKKINVTVGQMVKKGQTLIVLDDTTAKHGLLVSKIALKQAKNNVAIQEKTLRHSRDQLKLLKSIDRRAVSQAEIKEKIHEVEMSLIQLEQLQHNLDVAGANLKNAELTLSQFNVTAPKDGVVLQINVHVDEFAVGTQQVVFLGDAKKVMVRVSIDERDALNFNSKTRAYLKSNDHEQLKIPLKFIQLDRYIVTQERLNARVQEALYSFNRDDYPNLAAGQQFDAHILIKKS
ncbi:efflux RND transporter periplasmic adaptor subunit [Legionella fallonii]|uniref:Secretion protein HlyD n=1 Tax=Legionella fallonii LLAP-10 TaxID=1212491 RepID=A0A098GAF6_9GAMM|nr:HlyD family efflux transporter periplasmic adaptor subunit [Legionella fallonii]CEG59005.1 Secretion protein HlyD [Legionella fallonii LLAP-10]